MATLIRVTVSLPGSLLLDGIADELTIPVDKLLVGPAPLTGKKLSEVLAGKIVTSSVVMPSVTVTSHILTNNLLTVQFEPFEGSSGLILTVDCDPTQ